MSISTILFIIVAILIVYMLYKKYQGGSDVAPAPNRSSTGAPRIEIEETVLELNPDSSNKEEGYTTEQYTEFLDGDDQKTLSGNVFLQLEWATREGFGTVKELRFYRYLDSEPPSDSKTYANRKKDTTSLKPTKLLAFYDKDGTETQVAADKIKYRDNYAYILKSDDSSMFTSFKSGYKIKFGNKNKDDGGAYSVVGRTHMRIEYVLDDANNNTTGHLVPETFEGTDVTNSDLDLTLSLTETEARSIKPVYKGAEVTSDVVKEFFYVIPGPFETTDDGKIKIGGRRDLGNIANSELYPETGILMQYASKQSPFGTYRDNINFFTNHWTENWSKYTEEPGTLLDGFINDEDFKKRVHAQRGVMFRAAGDTEEFNIVVYKTKFTPLPTVEKVSTYDDAHDRVLTVDQHNNAGKIMHEKHHEFSDTEEDTKRYSKLLPKYNNPDNNYSGRIGLRRFHVSTALLYNALKYKPYFKDLEPHWEPANNDGGEFYVQIDDTSPTGWKLIKERTSASKFRLFKKDSKEWKKSDDSTVNLNVYNIQLVENGVTGEDRRFLVSTKHTDKFTEEGSSKHNDNKIYAKKIDATMSEAEYKSIDWVFVNIKDAKNGYKEATGKGYNNTTIGMIVDETKDADSKKLNDFNYDF